MKAWNIGMSLFFVGSIIFLGNQLFDIIDKFTVPMISVNVEILSCERPHTEAITVKAEGGSTVTGTVDKDGVLMIRLPDGAVQRYADTWIGPGCAVGKPAHARVSYGRFTHKPKVWTVGCP